MSQITDQAVSLIKCQKFCLCLSSSVANAFIFSATCIFFTTDRVMTFRMVEISNIHVPIMTSKVLLVKY